jgi:K+-sensing histidine kinase KdpD
VHLESARSRPGFGLGLSLAAAVARLHGGLLRLDDNAPGLRAVLELPLSPRPTGEVETASAVRVRGSSEGLEPAVRRP